MGDLVKSLGTRVALVVSAVLCLLLLLASYFIDRQLSHAIQQEEVEHVERQASSLMATLTTFMLNGNGTLARDWLDNLHGSNGILEIEVVDGKGEVAFRDTDTLEAVNRYVGYERFKREASIPHSEMSGFSHALYEKALTDGVVLDRSEKHAIAIVMPIPANRECLRCHGYDASSVRGLLALSVSTEDAEQRIASMRKRLWQIALITLMVLGSSLWLTLRLSVLRPIALLRDAIVRVGRGERSVLLPVGRHDELGEVAAQFNRMQKTLEASEARIRAVMDNVVDGIVTTDDRGHIESANPAVLQLFGYATEELIGCSVNCLMTEEHSARHDEYMREYLRTGESPIIGASREVVGRHKSGREFPLEVAISEMRVAGKLHFIAILRDITVRQEQTAALKYQALHDPLTDLPNRTLLFDRLKHAIAVSQREGRPFALMIMDLDRFKEVNDTLGHHIGDQILQKVAICVRRVLRGSDTVARLGGDEFSMLLPGTDAEHASRMARKILKELQQPFQIEGHTLEVGASLGIAVFPGHGEDNVTLMQRADVAMYVAKRSNKGFAIYDPAQDEHSIQQFELLAELRAALEGEQFLLHFQPKINLKSGALSGVESLLRWRHPRHGLLSPDQFLGLAEKSGLMPSLTYWVIEAALQQLAQFDQALGSPLTLSVNLSVNNIQDPKFAERLRGMLRLIDCRPERLMLEITETAAMMNPLQTLDVLDQLRRMGISLSIDHFGTGYSSLVHLKQMAVNEVKIDRSFTRTMLTDENSVVIVRSTIDLAHNLGLSVVADGLEHPAVLEELRSLGCDEVQGTYIAAPMAPEAFLDWARESRWRPRDDR